MRSSCHTLGFFLQVYASCFEFFSSYAVGWYPVGVYRIDPHATLWHHVSMEIIGSILIVFFFSIFSSYAVG